MEYLKSSYIIALVYRFLLWLTAYFRGGIFYRLSMWCWDSFKCGAIYKFCTSNQKTSLFERSILYNILTRVLNSPITLARRVQESRRELLGSSAILNYAMPRLIEICAVSVGLLLCATLIIPQSLWNNMYSFVGVVLIFALMVVCSMRERRFVFALSEIGAMTVLYFASVTLSFLCSQQLALSLRFYVFAVGSMLCVLLLVATIRKTADLVHTMAIVSFGVFVCSAYAILQFIVGVDSNGILTDLTLNADMPGRVYSFFENPNSFANILVLFAPIMLTMSLYSRHGIAKLWYLGVFGMASLSLIMTYSRGGWLSLAVSLAVLVLVLAPRFVPLAIIACVLSIPLLPDSILSRLLTIFSGADSSIYTRTYIYSAMREIIQIFPIFGAGLGATTLKHMVEATGVYHAEALFIHGHNIFLQIWGEMGLFGIVTFLASMAVAIRSGIQLKNCENKIATAVGLGASSALCGSLFFGITDYAWSYPRVMLMFWFVFALIPAAKRIGKTNL